MTLSDEIRSKSAKQKMVGHDGAAVVPHDMLEKWAGRSEKLEKELDKLRKDMEERKKILENPEGLYESEEAEFRGRELMLAQIAVNTLILNNTI